MPITSRSGLLLGASLSLIALATLTPGAPTAWAPSLARPQAADLLLNVALFGPLGLALRHRGWPVWRATAGGWLLSAGLELAQWFIIPGRNANGWDLLANSVGTLAGASLPPLVLALAPVAAWLGSAALLAPVAPPAPQWWGQWAHHFVGTVPFDGRIETVEFNGTPAPDRRLSPAETRAMRAGFLGPPVAFRVRMVPADPAEAPAHIASLADGQGRAVIALWQRGEAVEATWHSRGTAVGLRSPMFRVDGLLGPPTDPVVLLETRAGAGRWSASLRGPTTARTFLLWLGPWEGWRLFWPLRPPGAALAWLVGAGWTALCLGPLLILLSSGTSHPRSRGA